MKGKQNSIDFKPDLKPTIRGDFERDFHESLLIVLDTLEKCLSLQAAQLRSQAAAAGMATNAIL